MTFSTTPDCDSEENVSSAVVYELLYFFILSFWTIRFNIPLLLLPYGKDRRFVLLKQPEIIDEFWIIDKREGRDPRCGRCDIRLIP